MSIWVKMNRTQTIGIEKSENSNEESNVLNYQSASQRNLLFVCECEFEFFLLLTFFYFSSFQLDTLNDLMCDEKFNTVRCTDNCNNRSVILLMCLSLSLFFLLNNKRETRTIKQTMLTIEMRWPSFCLLTFVVYIFIYERRQSCLFAFHLIPGIIKFK